MDKINKFISIFGTYVVLLIISSRIYSYNHLYALFFMITPLIFVLILIILESVNKPKKNDYRA